MADKVYNVLFLSPHDAASGLMAEAILKRVGQGRFNAYSAGSFSSPELRDKTVRLLEKLNHDVSQLYSKAWDDFAAPDAPEMDFVFAMGDSDDGEPCPVWPGQPMTAYWSVPSPDGIEENGAEGGLALAEIYKELNKRIRLLVNLRVDALDRMALQYELDTIGSHYIS